MSSDSKRIYRATIWNGQVISVDDLMSIPADAYRELQAIASDLQAGVNVRLPRVITWRAEDGKPRLLIVSISESEVRT